MNIVAKFLKDKTVAYYVALGFAVLSVIVAIIYAAALGGLKEYISYIPLVLMIAGAAAFAGLSILGSCRMGCAVLSAADFAAFIVYAATIYRYPIEQSMGELKELPVIIVCGILMFVCALGSNILAWIRQRKRQNMQDGSSDNDTTEAWGRQS